jgi:acyl-CoA reductase-like NAD-dependent aldehyde dehydrogenase
MEVPDIKEAVAIANNNEYGLQAGIFTQDVDAAFWAARTLEVGGVMVNDTSSYHADLMPYGGVKNSGYGTEGPHYLVRDMSISRIVVLKLQDPPPAKNHKSNICDERE